MTTLAIRTDSEVERALEYLLSRRPGATRSDVVRSAILTVERAERRAQLRQESAALRDDPAEAEAGRVMAAEMARLAAW